MALGLRLGRGGSRLDTARGQRLGRAITPTPLCLHRPIQTISCASSLHGPCSSLEFPASGSKQQTAPRLSSKLAITGTNQRASSVPAWDAEQNRLQVTGNVSLEDGYRRCGQLLATPHHANFTLSLLVLATQTWLDYRII